LKVDFSKLNEENTMLQPHNKHPVITMIVTAAFIIALILAMLTSPALAIFAG
jgi:hypothetical protein